MPPVVFKPTIPVGERPQTYALDCTATGTGNHRSLPGFILSDQNRVQPNLCWSTSYRKALVGNYILTAYTNVQGCGLNLLAPEFYTSILAHSVYKI
jgi:hypothetical protein